MGEPIDLFFSYAAPDVKLLQKLEVHLAQLKREGLIRAWHAGKVSAGEDAERASQKRLRAARVVLLLVSADFLASDHVYEEEVKVALAREQEGARVLPVLLSACDWERAPFAHLLVLPRDRRPVTSWPNEQEALAHVACEIRAVVEELLGPQEPRTEEAPQPAFEDDATRLLATQITAAEARRKGGASAAEVEAEIRALRHKMREGGRLRAGDALGDGRYLLVERIGDGGFASVWRAFDQERREEVAVKVMHADQGRDVSRRERFFRGARVMGGLGHEAVVRVLDPGGEDGGYYYFVMELMRGGDLHDAVLANQLAPADLVPLLLSVGEALAEAHAKGFVHRDVKPENILLDGEGAPRLTDFDLVSAADSRTRTRGGLGTYLYMAPEQGESAKEADASADVYGLGMTAIFCLLGRELPIIMRGRPQKVIAGLTCGVDMKTVLLRAIEMEPKNRYSDARAFSEALRATTVGSDLVRKAVPNIVLCLTSITGLILLISTGYNLALRVRGFRDSVMLGITCACAFNVKILGPWGTEKRERRVQWFSVLWALLWLYWLMSYIYSDFLLGYRYSLIGLPSFLEWALLLALSWMLNEDRRSRWGLCIGLIMCCVSGFISLRYVHSVDDSKEWSSLLMDVVDVATYTGCLYLFISKIRQEDFDVRPWEGGALVVYSLVVPFLRTYRLVQYAMRYADVPIALRYVSMDFVDQTFVLLTLMLNLVLYSAVNRQVRNGRLASYMGKALP